MDDLYFTVGKAIVRPKNPHRPYSDGDPIETIGWGVTPEKAKEMAKTFNASFRGRAELINMPRP
jgi:hypothetical protein